MKRVALLVVIALLLSLPLLAAEMKLGKPIEVKTSTSIKELYTNPDKYLGKEVRIEGEIVEVCQNQGCFIFVKDSSTPETIQVKVNDGDIVFPKDGAGKKVIAQGKLEKQVLSKEQLIQQTEHYAQEAGKKADTSKITEGKATYRIKGEGAVIK
jgi:hypothetical protein